MSKAETDDARIAVRPVYANTTTTVCEVGDLPGGSNNVKGGIIKLKKNKAYSLSFEIQPETGFENLKFKAEPADAIWCCTDSCPAEQGLGGFLSNASVSPDQKKVTVDAGVTASDEIVHYRLNFEDGTNFDPIIIKN